MNEKTKIIIQTLIWILDNNPSRDEIKSIINMLEEERSALSHLQQLKYI